jgi:hypothetical protein
MLRPDDFGDNSGLPPGVLLEDNPRRLITKLKRPALLPIQLDELFANVFDFQTECGPGIVAFQNTEIGDGV